MSELYKDLSMTKFPNSIDTFMTYLDITAEDGPNIKRYAEAMQAGNIVLANQILSEIPNAVQKIIKATDLNKLTQAILAVERFYKSDIKKYIDIKQADWLTIIDEFDYKGDWSAATSYTKKNMVSYVDFGNDYLYIAVNNPPVGVAPTNKNYWRQMTIQGQQGISGTGLAYRQSWLASANYKVNDAVTYDGVLWMAIKPSKGVVPSQTSSAWKSIMKVTANVYPVQDIQPANQSQGDLWFNTQDNPTNFYFLETLNNPATSNDIAFGKQAYDDKGNVIIGTGTGGGGGVDVYWNDEENNILNWNEA